MVFKNGGAFDFQSTFEKVRESALQAMETARDSGRPLDPSAVHLDELPAYEDINRSSQASSSGPLLIAPTPTRPAQSGNEERLPVFPATEQPPIEASSVPNIEPDEPPPGYEETQSSSISNSLEDSLRRAQS